MHTQEFLQVEPAMTTKSSCSWLKLVILALITKYNFRPMSTNSDDYRPRSLAKQGDNALGSVRQSVCLFVCLSVCLSVCTLAECSKKQ